MSTQVIRQPNGLYAVYSNSNNGILRYDMTAEEFVQYRVERAQADAEREAKETVKLADKYGTSGMFGFFWEDAYRAHLEMGYDPIKLKEVNDA